MTTPLTLPGLRAAYAAGTMPEEIISQIYHRIAEIDDPAIFITLRDHAEVKAEVRALGSYDREKPLWGIPFAVKDNIDVAGLPTTAACPAWEYHPEADAFVVAKLRAAGAIVIGKTNLDQFATGLVGVRSPYGVPRNALAPEIVPGGSSSGSGVAVAQGIVTFALGTDTAGSGRVPAALNNIVGLKPSLGALSASGVVPACRSTETISIFATTVEDAYTAFQAVAEFDPADAYSKTIATPALFDPATGQVIGIPDEESIRFFGDEQQAQSFKHACALLEQAGHIIQPIDFTPLYAIADMLYEGAWVAERNSVIEDLLRSNPDAVLPVTRKIIGKAETLSATDAFRGFYRLKELSRAVEPVLAGLDALCVPTIPTFYSRADLEADPVTPNSNLGTYTNFVNLLDMCGLAIPLPQRTDGRPGGVTLLAKSGEDALLASLSAPLEMAGERSLGATGWSRPERQKTNALPPHYVKLAVCGAHLSGLPLNHQLTDRNAFLLRETVSAPFYRFFALAGDGVKRPGMIRTATQQPNGIALEVWAIPEDKLGSFLTGIPAPLGLGKVELESGETVCGFICEASGEIGAQDITHLASWRHFLHRTHG
ncbi:allophanate hydrolase [uncultured Martelella sp.]|uniref:allophanate hydrolase n=1 Tax=uncultured Martelella sp. TaxID=392331 RepID=UPI0029C96430|nr:allophanate hydrolase [uncultured Martelella sp.]